ASSSFVSNKAKSKRTIQINENVRAIETSATKVTLAMPAHINSKAQRIDSPIYLWYLYLLL
ncbi:MAG: hypothetical protein O3C37_10335, partial [Proteobacteria bacterium]|nr:hypothetical protein [Pseudomonadota bacterium]